MWIFVNSEPMQVSACLGDGSHRVINAEDNTVSRPGFIGDRLQDAFVDVRTDFPAVQQSTPDSSAV